ncbi:MAG: hypothetical protein JXA69_21215, partial [Phycisphaerae bacterium]|nr:hypothetical protein [Phycisphaerae bacterium]
MTSGQDSRAAVDTAVEAHARGPRSGRVSLIIAVLVASLTVASAIVFTGAKRRPAGDVWLGLAAGRLILERGYTDFPVADEFTWTFAGKTWYNQNWLSHVILYWTYDRLFPAAIVGLSLICLLIIAVSLILTTRVLCGETMLGALLVALGLVAGHILWQIRPDTATRICACLMLLVLVLTTYRHALWGLAVLPLLLFWSNAHGGFLLGYAMVGAWLA